MLRLTFERTDYRSIKKGRGRAEFPLTKLKNKVSPLNLVSCDNFERNDCTATQKNGSSMCYAFADGPEWSPRTDWKPTEVDDQWTVADEKRENSQTIQLVFGALRPFPEAYRAVIAALERAVEKERESGRQRT
jgi:hypothetical protein